MGERERVDFWMMCELVLLALFSMHCTFVHKTSGGGHNGVFCQ